VTEEQKHAYLKGGAQKCPYCGHDELGCDQMMPTDPDYISEYECSIHCMKCRREWPTSTALWTCGTTRTRTDGKRR
jgi:hypothetical protein